MIEKIRRRSEMQIMVNRIWNKDNGEMQIMVNRNWNKDGDETVTILVAGRPPRAATI